MQNIINIALNDLRIFFSQRGNIIAITVLPIFLTIALGIAFGASSDGESQTVTYQIDVIDNDKSQASAQLIGSLQDTGILHLCPINDACQIEGDLTLEASIQRLEDQVITATLVIPEGFEADLQAYENVSLPYYTDENLQSGTPVSSTISKIIERMNSAVVAGRVGELIGTDLGDGFANDAEKQAFTQAVYDRATTLMGTQPVVIRYVLSEQGEQDEQDEIPVGSGFEQSVPGIGAMQVLFTVLAGIVTLIRERKQWTLQRLAVLPITRAEILGGKILTYFTLGMFQYAILLVVGLIAGVNYGGSIIALLLLVSAFVLCVTALTFAIATRVTSEDQANSMSTLLALLLAPLGGAWWSLEIVPDFMKIIGHLSPVAWVMDGFNDLTFFGGGLIEILPEVGVLLVAAAVLFVVGVRGFQIGD